MFSVLLFVLVRACLYVTGLYEMEKAAFVRGGGGRTVKNELPSARVYICCSSHWVGEMKAGKNVYITFAAGK